MAQNIVTVALLEDAAASTSAVLDALVGAFSLVERTTLRITLPDDDAMLRALLAHEIATLGEAAALVRWAPGFTAAPFTVLVLALTSNDDACKVFLTQYASSLKKFGPIYASPTRDAAQMQRALLFPAIGSGSSEAGTSSSASTRATSVSRASQPGFKARAVPSSVSSKPTIEPRLSRAAALRMGIPLPTRTPSPTKTPAPASGMPKRTVPTPSSLRTPTIAPRLNKAALARQNQPGQARPSTAGERVRSEVDFSRTPGHKRASLSTSVASTAPPAIVPRQTRASLSRLSTHQPAVSPARPQAHARSMSVGGPRAQVDFSSTPGHKRALPVVIASLKPPTMVPRQNRASLARTSAPPQHTESPMRRM